MFDKSLWTILGLTAVGLVPLAALFLFFKPRPYQPPKDSSPSAMEEVLREPPESAFREPPMPLPWQIPGKPERVSNRDKMFGQWMGRGMRNLFVLQLYQVMAAIGVVVLILAAVLIASFT
jgi:hypothetical protein